MFFYLQHVKWSYDWVTYDTSKSVTRDVQEGEGEKKEKNEKTRLDLFLTPICENTKLLSSALLSSIYWVV